MPPLLLLLRLLLLQLLLLLLYLLAYDCIGSRLSQSSKPKYGYTPLKWLLVLRLQLLLLFMQLFAKMHILSSRNSPFLV